ncbi:MAG: acyl-CoA dehydrogenase family protein, partial [Pseudomonadota bacterium]|nr:acyl-CoA dehydrogenase family protein [Pseudomonadota bacterium]
MAAPQTPHGLNFFEIDRDLQAVLHGLDAKAFKRWRGTLSDFGAWAGGPLDDQASWTDRRAPPRLVTHDGEGRLVNRVETNPLWDEATRQIYHRGIVGLNHVANPAPYLVTFAMGYLTSQSDVSLHCPATMTHAVAHVIARFAPNSIRERYLQSLTRMDGGALSAGTWATELHGGSDIGATTTVARKEKDHFRLTGLKWFTSNVNGGIAVATARPEGAPPGSEGLGLYLVPTVLPDGEPNPMRIRRLKDKLGTTGVATGEVDLDGTWALEIAPPPEGFRLMMEALVVSRIHNAMSAVALQRRACLEALCFAANRKAFGNVILNYPMVQDELVVMLAAREADLALAFEAAHAFDQAAATPVAEASETRTWLRLATSLAKYQTAENANAACRKAIELIGGNGYTYDKVTPRLLRDAQVLTVWEGPANIQALELL